jgi:hypothetical protein
MVSGWLINKVKAELAKMVVDTKIKRKVLTWRMEIEKTKKEL